MAIWTINSKDRWKAFFSNQFKKIIKPYKRAGYSMDIMWQIACLVINTITVYSYGFLFSCTRVGKAPDSMMTLTKILEGQFPDVCL